MTGVDGNTLDIHNIVNIQKTANKELALRVMTDIRNLERVFYTDLNGFQVRLQKGLTFKDQILMLSKKLLWVRKLKFNIQNILIAVFSIRAQLSEFTEY